MVCGVHGADARTEADGASGKVAPWMCGAQKLSYIYVRSVCSSRGLKLAKPWGSHLPPKNIFPRPAATSGRFGRAPDSSPGPTRKVDRIKHFPETCVRSVRSVRKEDQRCHRPLTPSPVTLTLLEHRSMWRERWQRPGQPAVRQQRLASALHFIGFQHVIPTATFVNLYAVLLQQIR